MAKYLNDILKQAHDTIKGVRPSETSTLSTGKDPGVDYKPKAGDESEFIAKHSVQKWDDPAGNPNFADKVNYTLASPKEKLHGNTLPQAKAANEEVEQVEEGGMPASVIKSKQNRANMSDKEFADSHKDKSDADLRSMAWRHGHGKPGTPGHDHYVNRRNKGLKEEVQINELSTDLLHRAAHKAAKVAMTDVQGRSGPIFKKRAAQANKFRAKGMEQEKKEKAVKEEAPKKAEDVQCNSTPSGTECPVHGVNECMTVKKINEISTKLALNYAKGAEKSMDTAASKGSAGHETFMKRNAGHKLALDKTNPEHKRLKAKVGTTDTNAKDAAYKKAIGEEVIDEVLTKSTSAGETISDFVHSDNPKFAGKSKEKRKEMALAAYYAKQREQKEEVEQIDEAFDKNSKAHQAAKKTVKGMKGLARAEFHPNGSASVHTKGNEHVSSTRVVDHHHDIHGLGYNRPESAYKKSSFKKDGLTHRTQSVHGGHTIHIHEEVKIDENGPVAPVPQHLDAQGIAKKYKDYLTGGGTPDTASRYKSHVNMHAKKTGQHPDAINKEVRKHVKSMNEDLAIPLLGGDHPPRGDSDEAIEMVKAELKALANKAMHLVMQMPDGMHVEPWCQSKIAQAKSYISDVHDYMIYGDHDKEKEKEKENEGTMDAPITLPNMSVDVNTGQNV